MAREKILRNDIFSTERIVGAALELSTKMLFSLDEYRFRNMGLKLCFAIQRRGIEKFLSAFPRNQANLFVYSCSFTLHTTYINGMIAHGMGMGKGCHNAHQTIYYKAY